MIVFLELESPYSPITCSHGLRDTHFLLFTIHFHPTFLAWDLKYTPQKNLGGLEGSPRWVRFLSTLEPFLLTSINFIHGLIIYLFQGEIIRREF